MTRKTFYAKLRGVKNKFRWTVDVSGSLRGYSKSKKNEVKGVDFCPLTAVNYALTGEVLDCSDFDKAATNLGVSLTDARYVVDIADSSADLLSGNQITSRQHLLKNVGLKPEKVTY
jgi:hypothetical protein